MNLSHYDSLTGLLNREHFCELVARRLLGEHTFSRQCALLYLDLDRFRQVNDTFGTMVGDALLRAVARRLESCIGPSDLVGRLGEDHFSVFIQHADTTASIRHVGDRVMEALAMPFVHHDRKLYLTVSMGISLSDAQSPEAESLLLNAEKAMQFAKQQGRNTYRLYGAAQTKVLGRRLRLESELEKAIASNELFLVYQPILNLQARKITGIEALLRWRHKDEGVLTPDAFLALANETGLIVDIGEWVLQNACTQAQRWRALGYDDLTLSINFSPVQLRRPHFIERVDSVLHQTGLAPCALDVEVREAVAARGGGLVDVFHGLKQIGTKVSLDDFGANIGSLPRIKQMPVDMLKIDRSFVQDVGVTEGAAAVVRALAVLGRSLHIDVTAEGVETAEQLQFLARQGCHSVQGFYLSRPLHPEETLSFLQSEPRANWLSGDFESGEPGRVHVLYPERSRLPA